MEDQQFECWALVELLGHNRIAGKCTQQSIAGTNMLRVDVPETKSNPKFTRFISGSAVYAINPVTEDIALFLAEQICCQPIDEWDINKYNKKYTLQLKEGVKTDEDD
jgi:hypothetical protein